MLIYKNNLNTFAPRTPIGLSFGVTAKTKPIQESNSSQKIHPMIILGAGPAGLSAALTATRLGVKPLVIEYQLPGGQINYSPNVENYPGVETSVSGMVLSDRMRAQVESNGGVFQSSEIASIDISKRPFCLIDSQGKKHFAKSLIIATGAKPKLLGIPKEKELLGKGVYTCALCDGLLFQREPVVVVGGGDTAVTDALILAKHASHVTLVHRGKTMRAKPHLQTELRKQKNVKIISEATVSSLNMSSGKSPVLEQVVIRGQSGFQPLKTRALFLGLGYQPNTQWLPPELKRNSQGYLVVNPKTLQTSVPGVYACGEVHDDTYRQVTTATGYGTMAAMQVNQFLKTQK